MAPVNPAEALTASALQEEILGHVSSLLGVRGVEVGTSQERGGKVWEFIVTVPISEESQNTIRALEDLTADDAQSGGEYKG